jgi:hypothetical protein
MLEVKRQLYLATGVPVKEQHVMLSAINQLVMGDKRWGWEGRGGLGVNMGEFKGLGSKV